MVGIAKPSEGHHQDTVAEDGFDPANDFIEQQAVGKKRKVMTMLLESGDGNDDRDISVEGLNGRPGHIGEFHGAMPVKLALNPTATQAATFIFEQNLQECEWIVPLIL